MIIGGVSNYNRKDLKKHPRTKSEDFVIREMEKITGKSFPTVYIDWLKYDGRKMELDGYNDELKLAVEYNGPLHYKYYSNKESYCDYQERVLKDVAKKELCEKHGVVLVVVSYVIPRSSIADYLRSRLWDAKSTFVTEKPINYIPVIEPEPYVMI